jgi:tetratricopeptide (TPR) repeat protein
MIAKDQSDNIIAFGGNTMVYESVKRFALKGLNDRMRVLMENVDDALFELAEKVDNDRERSMYFEAMREIRLKRKSIEEGFDESMQSWFNLLILNKSLGKKYQESDELSLVDQSDIEDEIAIDNMITKARPHFEDDLFAVSERLKTILHRKQIKQDQNPLDPKAICDSFHNASSCLDTDIQVKLIFYKLFDKYVMANLGSFYRELNDFFISKGVLPEFKASQERLKQSSNFLANRSFLSSADSRDEFNPSSISGEDIPHNEATVAQTSQGNVLSMLQQLLAPAMGQPANFSVPQSGAVPGTPQTTSSGIIAPGGSPTSTSAIAYMPALTSLQSGGVFTQPLESIDPQHLKAELQQQLVTFKQENSHQTTAADKQIIDIVSMLFDFFFDDEALPDPIKVLIGRLQIPILKIAMLDSSFFNQKKHPARKLLDLISKSSLGWDSEAEREKLLVNKIDEIVEMLLTEFEEDVSVFDKALEDFKQFLDTDKRELEKNQELIEQEELEKEKKVQEAQKAANELLQKLESKHDLSFEVIDFLEGIWKSVLFNTYLTQGKESNHWNNLKKISSTLIWTLIPKDVEDQKIKLLKTLPPLLRALAKGMDLVQINAEQQNQVFQMLVLEHAVTVKQTSKNIVTRIDDKTVWPENKMAAALAEFNDGEEVDEQIDFLLIEDETGEIQIIDTADSDDYEKDSVNEVTKTQTQDVIQNLQDFTEGIVKGDIFIDEEIVMDSTESVEFHKQATSIDGTDDFLQLAQDLELGSWVEFVESDSKSLNAKLSWKSNVTGKCVFVNRQGHKVKNMTIYGFATELRSGRAKIIESVSVFDRAINSFISTLRH